MASPIQSEPNSPTSVTPTAKSRVTVVSLCVDDINMEQRHVPLSNMASSNSNIGLSNSYCSSRRHSQKSSESCFSGDSALNYVPTSTTSTSGITPTTSPTTTTTTTTTTTNTTANATTTSSISVCEAPPLLQPIPQRPVTIPHIGVMCILPRHSSSSSNGCLYTRSTLPSPLLDPTMTPNNNNNNSNNNSNVSNDNINEVTNVNMAQNSSSDYAVVREQDSNSSILSPQLNNKRNSNSNLSLTAHRGSCCYSAIIINSNNNINNNNNNNIKKGKRHHHHGRRSSEGCNNNNNNINNNKVLLTTTEWSPATLGPTEGALIDKATADMVDRSGARGAYVLRGSR